MMVLIEGYSCLTEEEKQVLELLGVGMTNREIARQLSVSPRIIKHVVKNLIAKLHAVSRSEAAVCASFVEVIRLSAKSPLC